MNKFKNSNQGVAAIEFAIILPLLLILLFGAFEVSRYIMANRRADNAANDLGFLLSREGCITKPSHDMTQNCFDGASSYTYQGTQTNNGVYVGGKTYLIAAMTSVMPLDMYPFPVQYATLDSAGNQLASDTKYGSAVRIGYIGLPVYTCPSPLPGSTHDDVFRNSAKIMWSQPYPEDTSLNSDISSSTIVPKFTVCNGGTTPCPKTLSCPNGAGGYFTEPDGTLLDGSGFYKSFFIGTEGNVDILYPGQSFLETRFDYAYQSILGDNFPFISAVLPHRIQKYSTYAVRSSYTGSGGSTSGVTASQITSAMQYCTDCEANSRYSAAGSTSGTMTGNPDPNNLQEICVPKSQLTADAAVPAIDPSTGLANPAYATAQNELNSGGCAFSSGSTQY